MQLRWLPKYLGHSWIAMTALDKKGNPTKDITLKKPPESKSKSKTMNMKGSKAALFGLPYLHPKLRRVVVCEGHWDVLALLSVGIEAVSSTTGAGTFREAWLDHFPQEIIVILCFDNDGAGRKGAEKVAKLIQRRRPDITLRIIRLPEDLGEGGDITDFLLRCRANGTDPIKALFALEEPYVFEDDEEKKSGEKEPEFEVRQIAAPEKPVTFQEWRDTIQRHFPDLVTAAEAGMSVIVQLLIRDVTNCFALVLVDVPSSGKTITINFFDEIPKLTYSTDTFTPASFVSNAANVKKEKLSEIDLLPRIRRKMFLLRDMATIFSARDDDLLKNLGILTRILDGEGLSTDTGVHGSRKLRGNYVFTLLAGSTPIPLRVWKAMGTLGPRLFFLGLHTKEKTEAMLVQQLRDKAYKRKELECRCITADFLRTLWSQYPEGIEWDTKKDDENILTIIARCAMLLARLRGQVIVYRDESNDEKGRGEFLYTAPVIEKPDRLNQCLYNFVRGHALAMGRTSLSTDDLEIVLRLTFDSAPGHRAPLFHKLLRQDGEVKTSDVMDLLGCTDTTARKEMRTLRILGICDEKEGEAEDCKTMFHITLKEDLKWFTSEECKRYLNDTGDVDSKSK